MYRFISSVKTFGKSKLLKYGLVTNTVFGIILRGVGDFIQQTIEINKGKTKKQINQETDRRLIFFYKLDIYDWNRTRNLSASGLVIGPFSHYWYRYLDKKLPQKTFNVICKKIFLDQLIGATVFTFLFIVSVCLLDGMSLRESLNEFARKFLYIYLVDWLIWPPFQAINFYLVPKELRVIVVNVILLFWNVFLSFAKYNEL